MDDEVLVAALLLDETLGDQYAETEEAEVEQGEEYRACYCFD